MHGDIFQSTEVKRAINWLLVITFLSMTLFPYHYHLHHDRVPGSTDKTTHEHTLDLHSLLDFAKSDHHEDSHTIEPGTDLTLNKATAQLAFICLVLYVLLIIPRTVQAVRLRYTIVKEKIPLFRWHTTPPLRAPPAR